jgi:hypothetical protein
MICAAAPADQPARGFDPDSMNRARIKPSIVELQPGATQRFYVVKEAGRLTGAYAIKDVQWLVNGVPGGNRSVGTITPDGLYRAPGRTPESSEIVVHGVVDDAVNRHHWATVLLDGQHPEYRTVESWTELMDDPITVYYAPPSFALESSGNILIAYNGGIHRYSPDEGPKGVSIELKGDSEKDLSGARNIAVDASGRIFVSDDSTGPPRIKVFSPEGDYLFGFGMKGIGDGRVMETRGMAFDSEQRFHIGDIDSMRVSVFDSNGGYLHAIGKKGVLPGEFNVPYGIAVDANDDLFVIGYYGPCQKLNRDGQFLLDFAYPDPPDGPILFTDVATDRWGSAYLIVNGPGDPKSGYEPVLDADGSRIGVMKYNNNGDWVCNLRMYKRDRQPLRVLVDNNDQVLVLFKEGEKVGIEFMAR